MKTHHKDIISKTNIIIHKVKITMEQMIHKKKKNIDIIALVHLINLLILIVHHVGVISLLRVNRFHRGNDLINKYDSIMINNSLFIKINVKIQ
jgi:hypothetical protein